MKKLLIILGALVVVVLIFIGIVALAGIGGYNRLNRLSQGVDSSWAQVENDYQRRSDLIPNLVSTVSGAANFEQSTLEAVTKARASVGQVNINPTTAPTDPDKLRQFQAAQEQLGSALSRLLVVSENYPQLKATANFSTLQTQLEGTENRIAVSRRDFNNAVQAYDTSVKSFPAVLYAGALGFPVKPYFKATEGAESAPKVDFNFGGTPAAAATNH